LGFSMTVFLFRVLWIPMIVAVNFYLATSA
jgi:hypothetical protein